MYSNIWIILGHPWIADETTEPSKLVLPCSLVPWISWVTTTFHCFTSPKQALGSCSEDDIAVRVLMRVIGAYPKKNLLLVDSWPWKFEDDFWIFMLFLLRSCFFFQNETCFVFFLQRFGWMDQLLQLLKLLNSPAPGNESYLGGVDGLVDGLSTRDCWISMNFFALKNIWNFFFWIVTFSSFGTLFVWSSEPDICSERASL